MENTTTSRTDLDITNVIYSIDVRSEDLPLGRMEIKNRLTLGSSDKCDFVVENKKIAPEHYIFKITNDVLTIHNLGGNEGNKIAGHELQHGKMYILDKGDKITFKDLEIIIRKDKIDELDFSGAKSASASKKKTVKEAIFKKKEEQPVVEEKNDSPATSTQAVKEKKVVAKKKKGIIPTANKTASFILRLYALFVSLTLAYGLLISVLPIVGLDSIFKTVVDQLSLFLPSMLSKDQTIQLLMQVYLVHAVIDILFNALLMTSLPLAVLGISSSGTRVRAILRTALGIFTTPIIILDLPLIFKKPSIKEFLSGAKLEDHHSIIRLAGALVILPVMIALGIFSPLILDLNNINGITIQTEAEGIQPTGQEERPNNVQTNSQLFNATFRAYLHESYELLPMFTGITANSPRQLVLYSHEVNKYLSFEKGKVLDLKSAITKASFGNPLFSVEYPNLNQLISSPEIKIEASQKDLVADELKRLTTTAMSLSLKNIPDQLLGNGFFISGLVLYRQELLRLLPIDASSYSISISKLGNEMFLIAHPTNTEENNKAFYLPLAWSNVPLYQLNYPMRMKGAALLFEQNMLSKTIWNFEETNFTNTDESTSTGVNAISVLDYFNQRTLDIEKFPATYLRSIAKKAISSKDAEYHSTVVTALKGISEMIKRAASSSNDATLNNLQNSMNTLMDAVTKKDESFVNNN